MLRGKEAVVPWLSMYLVDADVKLLCGMLDDDPDVALVRADGPGRWKAHRAVPKLPDGEHALWHIPSGPIELESNKLKDRPKVVKDAFKGWAARVPQFEHGSPWFGPGPLGIIRLTVRRKAGPASRTFSPWDSSWSAPANKVIGRSDFYWVGNYYGTLGRKAPKATELWWQSLRRRITKVAVQITSSGPPTRGRNGIWAFPAALEQIKMGALRADNP